MGNILKVREKAQLYVHLKRLDQTEKCWIFTFWDWRNKFEQTMVIPKTISWEGMCDVWEDLHRRWGEILREREWMRN